MVLGTVGTHAQGQTLYKRSLYNAVTDFTAVALLAEVPIVLLTRKYLPAKDFREFVTYAKANHAKMQYGSAGPAAASDHSSVWLHRAIGTDMTPAPYPGA